MQTKLRRSIGVLAMVLGLGGTIAPVQAGGGANIGRVAGDLTDWFNGAARPTVPPRTPELELRYDPPEHVPGGGSTPTWSTGQVDATPPPSISQPTPPTVGEGPWLTPTFEGAAR